MKWLLALLIIIGFAPLCLAQDTDRSIQQVADGLYRVTSGSHHAMYWVTDDGIVVLDTIDRGTAEWLKGQLAERHDAPVRYVVYSHNHYDHVYGGEVFDEPGVVFIAHEAARADLVRAKAKTRIPEITFTDEFSLHLGGQELRLRHHGPNNGRGSVSMHFVDQRVLFVVDWIVIGRMPFRELPGYDIEGMITSTEQVLALEAWDTLVGGHAEIGDRDDVARYLAYLNALYAAVRDGMLAGKSLDTLKDEIRLDEFSDLANYEEWLPLNIEGVYRMLADQSYMLDRTDVERPE
jgi:glyoxylase-like metal-dependent hydrolase (beta-lactamase superfamily II)